MSVNGSGWKTSQYVFGIFISFFLIFSFSASSVVAANLSADEFRETLSATLKALWTEDDISPQLEERQKTLKNMLKTGAVGKVELKNIMKEEISPILNHYKTSRYILQEMPERINQLFSPPLDWQTIKDEIIWESIASQLEKKDKEPFLFKFGTLAPSGTPWLDVPYKILVPKIVRLSGGALQLKFYTGGIMGEDPDVLRKMDIGQLDGCGCTTLGVFKASPDASVFMVPNLFHNYEEIDYIYKKFRKRLDRSFEKRGYICAAIIDTGFLYVFSKNKITGLADLRKQKALTSMGKIESTLLDELGVDVVPVAMPEVVSALSTGMADTFIAPAAWALGMQAYQYLNYYIKEPFFYAPGVVIVSTNVQDKICNHFEVPETLVHNGLELIVLEIKLAEPEWKKRARIYEKKALKAFEEKCGIQPVTLPTKDRQAFENAAKRVRQKLAGEAYPRDLLNDVIQALKQYRKNKEGKGEKDKP